jgi:hypothetical protein
MKCRKLIQGEDKSGIDAEDFQKVSITSEPKEE